MSHLINIAALQNLVPEGVSPLSPDVCDVPNTENLKKHFLSVFSRYALAKAFVVKSKKGDYRLRMDRDGLIYQEMDSGYTKEIKYRFEDDLVFLNNTAQASAFLVNFMIRLRHISEDVSCNRAAIYEEGHS